MGGRIYTQWVDKREGVTQIYGKGHETLMRPCRGIGDAQKNAYLEMVFIAYDGVDYIQWLPRIGNGSPGDEERND